MNHSNIFVKWSEGNPGALNFLMTLMAPQNVTVDTPETVQKLDALKTLRGTNMYVLWSDICNKDIELVHSVVKNAPSELLEEACSKQDYSGREMLKEYLNK